MGPKPSLPQKRKNFVLVGCSGTGKTTTCNLFLKQFAETNPEEEDLSYFDPNHEGGKPRNPLVSHKFQANDIFPFDFRIIDTHGFAYPDVEEEAIGELIGDLALLITDFDEESTGGIDAIVLVTKCVPRMNTLLQDLDALPIYFCRRVLQNLIIFVIDQNSRGSKEILKEMKSSRMAEIKKNLTGYDIKDIENCVVVWDNINPKRDQFESFAKKVANLKTATKEDLMKGADGVQEYVQRKLDQRKQILEEEKKEKEMA